jgi:hypothetical protein
MIKSRVILGLQPCAQPTLNHKLVYFQTILRMVQHGTEMQCEQLGFRACVAHIA